MKWVKQIALQPIVDLTCDGIFAHQVVIFKPSGNDVSSANSASLSSGEMLEHLRLVISAARSFHLSGRFCFRVTPDIPMDIHHGIPRTIDETESSDFSEKHLVLEVSASDAAIMESQIVEAFGRSS